MQDDAELLTLELTVTVTLDRDRLVGFLCDWPAACSYWQYEEPDFELPEDWIQKGLQTLAKLRYHRLGELLLGDYDAESLDCLVQAAAFGEIRYG